MIKYSHLEAIINNTQKKFIFSFVNLFKKSRERTEKNNRMYGNYWEN